MKNLGLFAAVFAAVLLLPFAAASEAIYQNPSTGYFIKTGVPQANYAWQGHNDSLTFAFITRNFPTSASDTSHVNQDAVRVVSLYPNNFIFAGFDQNTNSSWNASVGTIYYVTTGLDAFKIFFQNPNTGYFTIVGQEVATLIDGNALFFGFEQRTFPTSPGDVPPIENAVRISSAYPAASYGVFKYGAYSLGKLWFNIPGGQQAKTCDDLAATQSYYFNLCKNEGYDNVCFNKYSEEYQGCGRNSDPEDYCTESNTNGPSNILCSALMVPQACVQDVYATCENGFHYLKSKCVNGELNEVQYFADPCRTQNPTPFPSPTPPKYGDGTYVLEIGGIAQTTNGLLFEFTNVDYEQVTCIRAPCPPRFIAHFLVGHICLDGYSCNSKNLELGTGETKEIEVDGRSASISFNRVVDASLQKIEVIVKSKTVPPTAPFEFTIPIYFGWNMFSTPAKDSEDEMKFSINSQNIPLPPGFEVTTTCKDGPIYAYNAIAKKYDKLLGFVDGRASVLPQKGYWFKNTGGECSITAKGWAKTALEGLQLQAGWNFIGGPYDPTMFYQIKGDCALTSGPWFYNGKTRQYEKNQLLMPGKAYFVKVANSCALGEPNDIPPLPE